MNAATFALLMNAAFSLHLAHVAGWGTPGTRRFSQTTFTVLAMAALMLNSIRGGRAIPLKSLQPPRPQHPLTAWDLAGRVTAGLMGAILVGTATSRQPMAPDWWGLALSLAGFYGTTALAFWWRAAKLPFPSPTEMPTQAFVRDPFLSRPVHGVLVFRRPRWALVFTGLLVPMFAAPTAYMAYELANGMVGTRLSSSSAFLCLLFYGAFALLLFSTGYDIEIRFDLRDRIYRRTPTFWGIRRRGRTGGLDEIAGLRLCQIYSSRNLIWVQVVWRDSTRPEQSLTGYRDADVAQEQIQSLTETLDLEVLPPVFKREWRTRQ